MSTDDLLQQLGRQLSPASREEKREKLLNEHPLGDDYRSAREAALEAYPLPESVTELDGEGLEGLWICLHADRREAAARMRRLGREIWPSDEEPRPPKPDEVDEEIRERRARAFLAMIAACARELSDEENGGEG